MSGPESTRRDFLKAVGTGMAAASVRLSDARAGTVLPGDEDETLLRVDPRPRFDLSLGLHMQFMEPLGVTDSSVEAAWGHGRDAWREDVVAATRELGPTMMRWGGLLSGYYRWREGVGPRDRRKPMLNLCWGGVETNQIGTHEFVDFCRQVGAQPFCCVNFESEGYEGWKKDAKGDVRTAGPEEAAEWVDYCNNPDNAERKRNGAAEPFNLKLWQLGNETSYGDGKYDVEMTARRTIAFAQAMRAVDPKLELIGWGDSGWARRMVEIAGEHLQYLAFHHHFDSGMKGSPLHGTAYRNDPELTWQHLMHAHKSLDKLIQSIREEIKGSQINLAMTEGHFALPGRNRCEVLSTWAAGVAYARLHNVQERHGDVLKIATLADFCGSRWQVNALMIPVPGGRPFMMPVALIKSLFRHHTGDQGIDVQRTPTALDVTASRTKNRVYLHVVNTERQKAVEATLRVDGLRVISGRVFTLAADPEFEVFEHRTDVLQPVETALPANGRWTFPAASVSAVELDVEEQKGATG